MKIDFKKNKLVPVIVQDEFTLQVLMLGYMNKEALEKTKEIGMVTFFSRSKKRLWTKGEESGNYLLLKDIYIDCDNDTILIKAVPKGPTCHTGSISCFHEDTTKGFLYQLENIIAKRIDGGKTNSYTNQLFKSGMNKVAQKLGEEAVELVIEAKDNNKQLLKSEAADLLYHFLILLKAKEVKLEEVEKILADRHFSDSRV